MIDPSSDIRTKELIEPLLEAQKIFYAIVYDDHRVVWSDNARQYIKAARHIRKRSRLLHYLTSHTRLGKKAIQSALDGTENTMLDTYLNENRYIQQSLFSISIQQTTQGKYVIFQEINHLQKKIQHLQERWELLNNAQIASKLVNYEYDFIRRQSTWSEDMFTYIGYKKDELTPNLKNFQQIIHPDDRKRVMRTILRKISQKQSYSITFRMQTKQGGIIWVKDSGKAIYNRFGLPTKASGILQDITIEKKIEYELIQAKQRAEESDQLKSAFLANMSHEIRTPLNGIMGFSQLLSRPNLESKKRQQYISIINNSGEQLMSIISDIIDIAKIESQQITMHYREIDLHGLLDELHTLFKERLHALNKAHIKLICLKEKKEDRFFFQTDPIRLRQILSNLIYNAIKFTNQGIIEYGYRLEGQSGEIRFYVKDTGVGISQEKQKIIFERFRQEEEGTNRSYTGSGLGLTICKSLLSLMEGRIWLDSQKQAGSTFYVSLPLSNKS